MEETLFYFLSEGKCEGTFLPSLAFVRFIGLLCEKASCWSSLTIFSFGTSNLAAFPEFALNERLPQNECSTIYYVTKEFIYLGVRQPQRKFEKHSGN